MSLRTARLTDAEVLRMRRWHAEGRLVVKAEALRYGVGVETIRRALRGDTFSHLPLSGSVEVAPMPAGVEPPREAMLAEARKALEPLTDPGGAALDRFLSSIAEAKRDPGEEAVRELLSEKTPELSRESPPEQ